jgi:homospermidine synthase
MSMAYPVHAEFSGRILILGFGSIGQGTLPLILRHIGISADRIAVLTSDDRGQPVAEEYGVQFEVLPITRGNYRAELSKRLHQGDFLLNVSVNVSSVALIDLCQEIGCLYLDTCVEPWAGTYTDVSIPVADRTNYALRESALALNKRFSDGHTAVVAHGANPGMVSHFIKQALLNLSADLGTPVDAPTDRAGWAALMQTLGVRVVHVAERDSQIAINRKQVGEFVNTWSIDGFYSEGCQPAELGWGTHEKWLPDGAQGFDYGPACGIFLPSVGAATRVRTWTPQCGPILGYLITHNESVSTADYFTVFDAEGKAVYRPTSHYAYHPCDAAILSLHELVARGFKLQERQRLIVDEVFAGVDELGVLLAGHERGAYWFGSRLSIDEARHLAPHNNATSLQVTSAVLAGMIWAMENPRAGVVEPEQIDFKRCLAIQLPYLGPVVGVYSDWTPLADRGWLFEEDLDTDDPWQFRNILVR